ncbi:MAG: DUF4129 domain-containing transglutaminase family protein [Bradymonadia bacterium]
MVTAPIDADIAPAPIDEEPIGVLILKALIYAIGVWAFIFSFSTPQGQITGAIAAPLAVWAARRGMVRRLRARACVIVGVLVTIVGLWFGHGIVNAPWLANGVFGGLSTATVLKLSDAVLVGVTALGVIFTLRSLGARYRAASVVEAVVVVAAVSFAFASHRNAMIHQPRILSDWAWSNGIDPQSILLAIGVCVSALALLVLLRVEQHAKLVVTVGWVLVSAVVFYQFVDEFDGPPAIEVDPLTLGTPGQGKGDKKSDGKDGKGGKGNQGGGQGGGQGNGNGDGGGGSSQDQPVAVAIFHEDYDPPGRILYFRQQVFSYFDGNHLSPDPTGKFDQDVITEFPQSETLTASPVQVPAFHVEVPTSMYLMTDHPQPFALTNSVAVSPVENPSPQRFVSAYGVKSLALSMPYTRLTGRRSIPGDWSPEQEAHYLQTPDDPRYQALSDLIVRDIDPRFVGDDLVKALTIKRYLEQNGFYTRKETYEDVDDPTAAFLFGSMRGYCVHFAHSAVHLFRSQGIAARVAVGYAVDNQLRGAGSAVLIMAQRAHAWPEIYIDGVGWLTFDIYPSQSDEPPPQMVATDLESLMGELARNDPTGGKGAGAEPFEMPWGAMARWLALCLGVLLALGYAVKIGRQLAVVSGRASHQLLFAATLDRFSDGGLTRKRGETRERYARRLKAVSPSLETLTHMHLKLTLGAGAPPSGDELRRLSAAVRAEWARNTPLGRRLLSWANPLGWWFTR